MREFGLPELLVLVGGAAMLVVAAALAVFLWKAARR